jgi:hypothetical protein
MPLDVDRLRNSDIAAVVSADAFRAAVLLWCASWHQIPPGSLPKTDEVLSNLAGFGRDLKRFRKVKAEALHGFQAHPDLDRYYHPVIDHYAFEAAKKSDAWRGRMEKVRAGKTAKQAGSVTEPVTPAATTDVTADATTPATSVKGTVREVEERKGRKKDSESTVRSETSKQASVDVGDSDSDAERRALVAYADEKLGPESVNLAMTYARQTSFAEAKLAIDLSMTKPEPIKYLWGFVRNQRRIERGIAPATAPEKPKPDWERTF